MNDPCSRPLDSGRGKRLVVSRNLLLYCYIQIMSGDSNFIYLLRATCAAMTRCLSTTSWQLAQEHSRHRHNLLWPFRLEITPWLRQRAHFGVRNRRRTRALVEDSSFFSLMTRQPVQYIVFKFNPAGKPITEQLYGLKKA